MTPSTNGATQNQCLAMLKNFIFETSFLSGATVAGTEVRRQLPFGPCSPCQKSRPKHDIRHVTQPPLPA